MQDRRLGDLFTTPGVATGIDQSRPVLQNPDGTVSTELTATEVFRGPDGSEVWLNFPTIHEGRQLDLDAAIKLLQSGVIQPTGRFNTLDEALAAAKARSAEIGRVRGFQ